MRRLKGRREGGREGGRRGREGVTGIVQLSCACVRTCFGVNTPTVFPWSLLCTAIPISASVDSLEGSSNVM